MLSWSVLAWLASAFGVFFLRPQGRNPSLPSLRRPRHVLSLPASTMLGLPGTIFRTGEPGEPGVRWTRDPSKTCSGDNERDDQLTNQSCDPKLPRGKYSVPKKHTPKATNTDLQTRSAVTAPNYWPLTASGWSCKETPQTLLCMYFVASNTITWAMALC